MNFRLLLACALPLLWTAPVQSEPHLRASQVGYRPGEVKLGVAFASAKLPERFRVVDNATGGEVFAGTVRPLPGEHWAKFEHHAELDFSALRRPGRYHLEMAGTNSLPFTIAEAVFTDLPGKGLEFMRQQRCGHNPWLGTNCHHFDGRTAYGPLPAGTAVDAVGGWHDAGDLLKYLLTSGNATAQLLLAAQLAPTNAPYAEALRAEARWGVEWLLKMHPATNLLFHQVADDRDHIGLRLPQDDTVDYGWGKGGPRVVYFADGRPQGLQQYQSESTGVANLAGRHAAALALAWQLWRDNPAERAFAERCLAAAKSAYEMGRAQEGVQQGNSYKAPYRYEETTWADDMEWGATELFRASREPRYLEEARRYAGLAASESWMGRADARHYQFYPFMNLGHYRLHGVADDELRRQLADNYRDGLARCVEAAQGNPWRVGVPFIWCSANLVVALATQGELYERMTGETRFRDFSARQRDWLLGRNPWGYTLITGVGAVFPTEVHLQTTRLTGRQVPGGLVDGPVYERIFKSLRGVSITLPDPLADFQDERAVYHNDFHDYSTNEPTMDGSASAILLWVISGMPR